MGYGSRNAENQIRPIYTWEIDLIKSLKTRSVFILCSDKMPRSSRGRRARSAVSARDIEMRTQEEEMEFRRELERV